MMLKKLVLVSIICFCSMAGLILVLGLVISTPQPTAIITDPLTGQPVTDAGAVAVTSNGSVVETNNQPSSSTPTSQGITSTPKPGSSAGAPTPTPKPGSTLAPTPTPKPTAAPTPTPTPPPSYCAGRTPCYGHSDIAAHATSGSCWGFNIDRVYNLTSFAPHHPGGSSVILNETCGKNLASLLAGSNSRGFNHNTSTKNNTNSIETPYIIGYYDGSKP